MGFVISFLSGWKPVCCWHSAAVEIGLISAGLLEPRESLAIYSRPAVVGTGGQKFGDRGLGQRVPSALQPADREHTASETSPCEGPRIGHLKAGCPTFLPRMFAVVCIFSSLP